MTFVNLKKKVYKSIVILMHLEFISDSINISRHRAMEILITKEFSKLDFTITGPDQVRPSEFTKELKESKFKEAVADFLYLIMIVMKLLDSSAIK